MGIGTQMEAFVSYFVTPRFSIGGGYWAMWTTGGEVCREPPEGRCPAPEQNMQYKTERFGVLLLVGRVRLRSLEVSSAE